MTICGIYKLNFNGTDKVYIGKGLDVKGRYASHKRKLLDSTHTKKMMEAYKLYGLPSMEIVLECTREELNATEDEVIEIFDSVNNGFNTLFSSEDTPENTEGLPGELHGSSKHSNEEILSAFHLINNSAQLRLTEIASRTKISCSMIRQIAAGTKHKWISEIFPEEYKNMMSQKYSRASYSNSAKARGIIYPAIKSPDGEVHTIDHITNFCKKYNLNPSALVKVCNKERKSHKNWTLAN